jgi:hypothetical protein
MLKRFPVQERTQVQIGKLLNELCASDGEAEQFVSRVIDQHSEWPGPAALRELHGEVASSRAHESMPQSCEHCNDGWRPVFHITERTTGHVERILPDGDKAAIRKQHDELFRKYRGSRTHVFTDTTVTPCGCAAGRHADAEARRGRRRRTA